MGDFGVRYGMDEEDDTRKSICNWAAPCTSRCMNSIYIHLSNPPTCALGTQLS